MHKRRRCSNILILGSILDHIFGPKKHKLFCPVFVFRRRMSNVICDLVLYLLSEGLNISWIYTGTIPFHYIKLCGKSIALPLRLIFQSILNDGDFQDDCKKSHNVPCHKKDSKNLIKNYRPISLLPIFSKVFERLIYNSLYNYFIQNKLFTECQSGFMPGDSCVARLLSITHEICNSFDYNSSVDIRGVFLDISKAFHKVKLMA